MLSLNKFKNKAFINKLFSSPFLFQLYHPLRAKLGKEDKINIRDEVYLFHKKNIIENYGKVAVEIGAGENLAQNIFLSQWLEEQYLYDINKLINIKKINAAISAFKMKKVESLDNLSNYSIFYSAPCDFLKIDKIAKNKPNFFLSSSTFEHIPINDLNKLLIHLKTILSKEATLSLHIDYSDHFSHNDSTIRRNNFLRFSNMEWKKYNTRILYQNRLRHEHYKKLFLSNGYIIAEDQYLNYDEPPSVVNKELLSGNDSDFFTTGRWVLKIK